MRYIRSRVIRQYIRAAVLLSAIMGLLWLFGGQETCYFKGFFGIPCPGCGLTRAYLSFFTGDFSAAFFYHPLFWTIPAVILPVLFRRNTLFGTIYDSNYFWITVIIMFLGVYLVRLVLFFPETPPMDFNSKAILIKLFHYLSDFLIRHFP
jgi:hypothetical protein